VKTPASYEGTAVIYGDVAKFAIRLNPERWRTAFPSIWTESYFTDPEYFVPLVAGKVGAVGMKRQPGKPPRRSSKPKPMAKAPIPKTVSMVTKNGAEEPLLPPSAWDGFLYEEALFGGYSYRNILRVSYRSKTKGGAPTAASYEYSQHACLNTTRDPLEIDGGLDVDWGIASVSLKKGSPVKGKQRVEVKVGKKVRFTKPATLVDEMNDLGHLFVPLSLDSWLHDLIFKSPEEEKNDG
jgi:hypothetical protein